ncbi:hypothetical protein JIN85_10665 [Luteolibacter pohnpeiensis]|uniref:Uncharacterized protein n=1 Tax=Luteolibacter pohnpeiensis TaxID=454153 RepID=A0A934S4A0_9BACT|nr:hypothetical protein [Luteolibacter pohnpeiensis]MBK1882880.1 hypothetical protein [Luteolibacter pohnpeiensis]
MTSKSSPKPDGHVAAASLVIGSLAMLLTGGFALLHLLERLDLMLVAKLSSGIHLSFSNLLPAWQVWGFTLIVSYGIAASILAIRGNWRRWIFWLVALGLIIFWVPVLILASYEPKIAAPFIAGLWSGICAMVYVGKHRMPGED